MVLTAVILSNKEEKDIRKTVNSVSFADEIVVIKDSTDKTDRVSGKLRIISRPLNSDFSVQRNFGLSNSKGDWVIFVDDDEVVSKSLASEIKKEIGKTKFDGYFLKRLDIYYDQVLKHGETGNTYILRLSRKGAGEFARAVHEVWMVNGRVGKLINPLFHYRTELTSPFINRISLYGPIDAKSLNWEGKKFSLWRLILNPIGKFLQNYIVRLGFLDGYLGLFQAYLMSVQSLSVRVFQWQTKL